MDPAMGKLRDKSFWNTLNKLKGSKTPDSLLKMNPSINLPIPFATASNRKLFLKHKKLNLYAI